MVLVRSMDSVQRLPPGLQGSNALTLTIPQARVGLRKGGTEAQGCLSQLGCLCLGALA